VAARALGVLHTATYDAWSAYDPVAVDTRQRVRNLNLRRPAAERNLANKNEAISYAAYRVLVDLFPGLASDFGAYLQNLGYDLPSDPPTTDLTTPEGIGISAADAVLEYRHSDGSNQQPGTGPDGQPAALYPNTASTPYSALNTWNDVPYRWHWQPLCVLTAAGVTAGATPFPVDCSGSNYSVQNPLTPQWGYIKSFSLNDNTHYPSQFQLPGPPKLSDGTCCDPKDVDTALSQTSNLTDIQKTKADYWADGGGTEFPPGHMAVFAQALSRMRKGTLSDEAWLDRDVKLFFGLGNAMMDASISSWYAKYQYDFVRPTTAIRVRYKDKLITSWLGAGKGYGKVLGQNWRPFQEPTVLTPPFPEYVSGHSTFSGAGGVLLGYAFGTNGTFNAKVTIQPGNTRIEPGITPAKTVVLSWKTLDDASDDAGWSRRWGGIHFQTGDEHGRGLGKTIGYNVWTKAQTYFNGKATDTTLGVPAW